MSDPDQYGRYASPPCLACEVVPDYFDPMAVDPQQARDVARWRKAEPRRLQADRQALSVTDRASVATALTGHLFALLSTRFEKLQGKVVSVYWPIKGEPDLRPLMAKLHASGVSVCLPVIEQKAAPLVFRRWTPTTRMVPGDWDIPVPPPDASALTPEILVAPLMGWDPDGFHLGHGSGYFDRTLAALNPWPFIIGVGFESARLPTVFPQPDDIPLDPIVTEAGVQVLRNET